MTINVNHSSDRIDPPAVTLNGALIDTDTGIYGAAADVAISTQHIRFLSTTEVNHRAENAFQGDVTITLTPDASFTSQSYTNRSATDIVGFTAPTTTTVNQKAETYYTLNGKDPSRTKNHLYTGAFTVRRNETGSDNFILKARTYCNGTWSEVRTVEFRIVRASDILV